MKRKNYMIPHINICKCLVERSLLAAESHESAWNPTDSTPSSTINIVEETDGNLGDEDSEISGAKGHNAWSNWED